MIKISDKVDADVAYLTSAIVRDAMTEKFKNILGLDPVQLESDDPMTVTEGKVPEEVLSSVDPDIAPLLKASAVENNYRSSGEIPEVSGSTLLYSILNDQPASISLEAVEEYTQMDKSAVDATTAKVSEQDSINISDGIAYLTQDHSGIEVGIFVDNEGFGKEFQYRIENIGGNDINGDEKLAVFNELFEELPGGDNSRVEGLHNELLGVVGLTSYQKQEDGSAKEIQNPAPGPDAQVNTPDSDIETVNSTLKVML